jgi:opacity protein-like surface antigen
MKKILSAAALSTLLFSAGQGIAGNMRIMPPSLGQDCPEGCQDQLDDLHSSQARQDEQLEALEQSQARQDEAIQANADDIKSNLQEIENLKNLQHEEVYPWYVRAAGQINWMGSMDLDKAAYGFQADTDTGYGFGFALGRRFGNLRIEGELAGQTADIKGEDLSDITISTAMLNGFYGIPIYGPFSIYGRAGAGTAKVEVAMNGAEDSEVTFAYKAGAGITMDMKYNMAVDLGYEYLRTGDVELGHDHELLRIDDMKSSGVNASVRYAF